MVIRALLIRATAALACPSGMVKINVFVKSVDKAKRGLISKCTTLYASRPDKMMMMIIVSLEIRSRMRRSPTDWMEIFELLVVTKMELHGVSTMSLVPACRLDYWRLLGTVNERYA